LSYLTLDNIVTLKSC